MNIALLNASFLAQKTNQLLGVKSFWRKASRKKVSPSDDTS